MQLLVNCPINKSHEHTTQHLFTCPSVMTILTLRDLWDDPVAVAELLQIWDDVRGAAGGGLGSGLSWPVRLEGPQTTTVNCNTVKTMIF